MSWLRDVKSSKQRSLEQRKDWGYMCGYCSNSFFADLNQLEEHQNVETGMCKGKDDKYDKELAIERGIHYVKDNKGEIKNGSIA